MKKKYPFIYLASQSSRRKQILKQLRIAFKVVPSSYREKNIRGITPRKLVLAHAEGKARRAQVPRSARYVLAADTVVVLNGKILGKPRTKPQAFRMLQSIQGKSHLVYTGLVLADYERKLLRKGCAVTRVWIKKMKGEAIDRYMKEVHPLDKAGSYGIQEGPRIVDGIKGSYSNVVGLPVELLKSWFWAREKRSKKKPSMKRSYADNQ